MMRPIKWAIAIAVAGSSLVAVAPAGAVITTFADYKAIGTGSNIYWKNDGTSASNGFGGSLYTIASNGSKVPGTVKISFSFLQDALAPYVTNVTADFTLLATVTNTPALTTGVYKIQPSIAGSFTILTTGAITIGNTVFAAGSNLLSGSFTQAAIFGQTGSTSGSISSATTSGATINYSSDFLSFLPTVERDFALSLTSITSPLASSNARALRTFRALSTGSFSTDPEPIPLIGVPEAASWAMFVTGFGLMGATLRRRRPGDVRA